MTLIEVLIALVLVALGTLAIVLLQLSSKRNNLDAVQRASAAQAGYGYLERIRANNTADGLGAYLTAAAAGFDGADGYNQNYTGPNCGAGASCTPQQLAAFDSMAFERELAGLGESVGGVNTGGLVNPVACLAANPPTAASTNFTLTIVWRGAIKGVNNSAVTCGAAKTTASGERAYGSADEFRRYLVLDAFVARRDL